MRDRPGNRESIPAGVLCHGFTDLRRSDDEVNYAARPYGARYRRDSGSRVGSSPMMPSVRSARADQETCRFSDMGHSWVAGMMYVPNEDLVEVGRARRVECELCETVYRPELPR